ncbi:hypothetical protein [Erwinia tasmaniensis]|nr:hypothetical protein [Erwinia tasmaniensis]
MELRNELAMTKRVSWGSIIAGVVTAIAVSLLLTTLGTSLGLSMLSPKSDDIVNGADTAVLAWSVIGVIVSLACGGFITGRLAGADGAIHGFLIWATSLLVATILGFAAVGGVLNTAGNAVGGIASATGSVASGIGSAAGHAAQGTANIGEKVYNRLGLDTKLQPQDADKQVMEALKKSGIKELQPEYLQSQLEAAGDDLANAAKDLAMNPENSDAITGSLMDKLKNRAETVGNAVDKNDVKKALAENTSMTPEQADKAVDNFIQTRDKAVEQAKQRFAQLEDNLNQAKAQYAELKQQAKEKADAAAKVGAKVALWSFFGLLIGAIVSTLSGLWGVNTLPGRKKIKA